MLWSPLGAEGEGAFALVVDPWWILVSIVQFLLLFFLLRKILWGPVTRTLDERAARIREGLAAAEAAKREREQMQAEVERLMAEARREAAAIAERATRAAETAAAAILAEARGDAEAVRQRARADAEQLHQQALAQLRQEVAAMAVLAAGRVLGREIDPRTHRELIERSIDEAGGMLGRPS